MLPPRQATVDSFGLCRIGVPFPVPARYSSPNTSRSVRPRYSVRNRPRRCSSGTSKSTIAVKSAGLDHRVPQHEPAAAAGRLEYLLQLVGHLRRRPGDRLLPRGREPRAVLEELRPAEPRVSRPNSCSQLAHEPGRRCVRRDDLVVQLAEREVLRQRREVVAGVVGQIGADRLGRDRRSAAGRAPGSPRPRSRAPRSASARGCRRWPDRGRASTSAASSSARCFTCRCSAMSAPNTWSAT